MPSILIVPALLAAALLSACVTFQPDSPGLTPGTRTITPDGATPVPAQAAPLGNTGIHPIGVTPAPNF